MTLHRGSVTDYGRGCRCEPCSAAMERAHGTLTGYAKGKCRCPECRGAQRIYDAGQYSLKADMIKQRKSEKYAAEADVIAEQRSARRAADTKAAREADRRKYAANQAARAAQKRAARAANPERIRANERDRRRRTGKGRVYAAERRARELNAFVEHVDPIVVFERDNYVCQRCGNTCPIEAKWPRLDAATHDHIVALANGGEHSYANAQTLCFGCNVSKGNRPNKTPPVCDAGRNDAHRVTTITAS